MKKIVFKDDFAFVYLSKNFYDVNVIKKTIEVYSEFVSFSFGEVGKYFVLKAIQVDLSYSLDVLVNEFLNYLVSEEFSLKWILIII